MQKRRKQRQLVEIRRKLKDLLVTNLSLDDIDPESIDDDDPLFGEGLGLDSLDAVELVVILQRSFGVEIKDMEMGRRLFASVNVLAEHIYETAEGE